MSAAIDIYVTVTGQEELLPWVHDPAKYDAGTGRARLVLTTVGGSGVYFTAKSAPALLAFFRSAVAAVEPLVPAEVEA